MRDNGGNGMEPHTRRAFLGQLAATTLVAAIPSMTGSSASAAEATTAPGIGGEEEDECLVHHVG